MSIGARSNRTKSHPPRILVLSYVCGSKLAFSARLLTKNGDDTVIPRFTTRPSPYASRHGLHTGQRKPMKRGTHDI